MGWDEQLLHVLILMDYYWHPVYFLSKTNLKDMLELAEALPLVGVWVDEKVSLGNEYPAFENKIIKSKHNRVQWMKQIARSLLRLTGDS